MKKKVISVILCLCMMLPFTLAAHAQEPLNYLLLGDSIAQGYGVYNRDKACYGKIVADTNGYSYANYAVNGYRSCDLISQLGNPEVNAAVENADIISLSIGGNDFLQQNLPRIAVEVLAGNYKIVNDVKEIRLIFFIKNIRFIFLIKEIRTILRDITASLLKSVDLFTYGIFPQTHLKQKFHGAFTCLNSTHLNLPGGRILSRNFLNLLVSEKRNEPTKKPTAVNNMIKRVLKNPNMQSNNPITKNRKAKTTPALVLRSFSKSLDKNLSILTCSRLLSEPAQPWQL